MSLQIASLFYHDEITSEYALSSFPDEDFEDDYENVVILDEAVADEFFLCEEEIWFLAPEWPDSGDVEMRLAPVPNMGKEHEWKKKKRAGEAPAEGPAAKKPKTTAAAPAKKYSFPPPPPSADPSNSLWRRAKLQRK